MTYTCEYITVKHLSAYSSYSCIQDVSRICDKMSGASVAADDCAHPWSWNRIRSVAVS